MVDGAAASGYNSTVEMKMGDFEITISEAEIIAAALEIAMAHTPEGSDRADFEAVLALIERHLGE